MDEDKQGKRCGRLGELVEVLMPPEEDAKVGIRKAAGAVRLDLRVPSKQGRVGGIRVCTALAGEAGSITEGLHTITHGRLGGHNGLGLGLIGLRLGHSS